MKENTEQLIAAFRRQVIRPLERLGRSIKRQVLIDGLACCIGALVAMAVGQFLLDRMLVLGIGPRIALVLVVVSVVGHQLYRRVLKSIGLRVNVNDVASLVERKNADYGDRLVTAVAFATGNGGSPLRNSPALVGAFLADSLQAFQSVKTHGVLRRDQFGRRVMLGVMALALAFVSFATMPELMGAYIQRNWLLRDAAWPVSVKIVAEGFDESGRLRWPIGDELKIVAREIEGDAPSLYAEFEYGSGETIARDMDRLGANQFILDYGPLVQDMKVRFVIAQLGVDERTEWYSIEAVSRPGVRSVRIEISPPDYTDKETFVLAQGQASADLIRGSSVRIDAEMNKPVTRALLKSRADESSIGEVTIEDGTKLSTTFVPQRKGTYFFDVVDEAGLDDRAPVTYSLNLLSDPSPKVRLTLPGAGDMVTPGAQLRLAVEAEDDIGMQSVELAYATRASGSETAGEAKFEPLPDFAEKQQKYSTRHSWPLLALSLKPGDQLTLHVRATDYQPVEPDAPEPDATTTANPPEIATPNVLPANQGESIRYALRVVTPEDLLAELGRRENEWRREFEQIIKAQEQLNRRVIELRDLSATEAMSGERAVRYGQESRTQRQQISRIKTVQRQFQQILDEMEVNDLATPQVHRRLQNGVIAPLKALVGQEIPLAADLLDALRNQIDEKTADSLEETHKQIIRAMNAILADMLKWEGYNEAVALVREVVRLQQEVHEDTKDSLDREIEKLFGEDQKPATQPAREDEP